MKSRIDFKKMKENGERISMITAYDYPSARMAEEAEVDMILVGDSLGMVVLGYDSTIPVTVEDMIHHGKAVVRGAPNTFVVVDMPFMSYHVSMEQALTNGMKIYQSTQAQSLKLEGAGEVLPMISKLTNAGIPVVGHLGLTPQSVNVLGGYRVQGKSKEQAKQLIDDAKAVEAAGAVALVLECVPKELSKLIQNELSIPTIGIGAGIHCDGQVLVYHDVLTYGVKRLPKFVKPYADGGQLFSSAISTYVKEVKDGTFPGDEHSFTMDPLNLPSTEEKI